MRKKPRKKVKSQESQGNPKKMTPFSTYHHELPESEATQRITGERALSSNNSNIYNYQLLLQNQ